MLEYVELLQDSGPMPLLPNFGGGGGEGSKGVRFVRVEGFFGFRNLYGAQGLALVCRYSRPPPKGGIVAPSNQHDVTSWETTTRASA